MIVCVAEWNQSGSILLLLFQISPKTRRVVCSEGLLLTDQNLDKLRVHIAMFPKDVFTVADNVLAVGERGRFAGQPHGSLPRLSRQWR